MLFAIGLHPKVRFAKVTTKRQYETARGTHHWLPSKLGCGKDLRCTWRVTLADLLCAKIFLTNTLFLCARRVLSWLTSHALRRATNPFIPTQRSQCEWRVARSDNRDSNCPPSINDICGCSVICIGPLHTPYEEPLLFKQGLAIHVGRKSFCGENLFGVAVEQIRIPNYKVSKLTWLQ